MFIKWNEIVIDWRCFSYFNRQIFFKEPNKNEYIIAKEHYLFPLLFPFMWTFSRQRSGWMGETKVSLQRLIKLFRIQLKRPDFHVLSFFLLHFMRILENLIFTVLPIVLLCAYKKRLLRIQDMHNYIHSNILQRVQFRLLLKSALSIWLRLLLGRNILCGY